MSSQPTTQQPPHWYTDPPPGSSPSPQKRTTEGSVTTRIRTNARALGNSAKGLRSDMAQLWQMLQPYYYAMSRALRGKFAIRNPYNVRSPWLRRLIDTVTTVAGLLIGVRFFFQYELQQSVIAVLMGMSVGAGVMLVMRRPIVSWQLFLVTMVLAFMGFTYDYGPLEVSQIFVIIMAIRLTALTDRPFRWIVPLTTAGFLALVNIVFFNDAMWLLLIPIMAVIAFVIDNNRTQHEANVSREAAEQAAAEAGHIAAVAGKMAAEAKTEIIALGNREAILKERSRIARDLHDVVAHHMSMVVVRAQTTRYRLEDVPQEIIEELDEIADLARQSLSEVRDLLSVLRSDSDVILAPQPTLEDLPELIAQSQASGMLLTWEPSGELPVVSTAVSIASYRVIQEGLANVRRHSHDAETEVFLMAQGNSLIISLHNGPAPEPENINAGDLANQIEPHPGNTVEIEPEPEGEMLDEILGEHRGQNSDGHSDEQNSEHSDEPVEVATERIIPEPPSIGHGLLGVQERVHAVGGTMSAGPTSDGGYLLYVRLPIERQESGS